MNTSTMRCIELQFFELGTNSVFTLLFSAVGPKNDLFLKQRVQQKYKRVEPYYVCEYNHYHLSYEKSVRMTSSITCFFCTVLLLGTWHPLSVRDLRFYRLPSTQRTYFLPRLPYPEHVSILLGLLFHCICSSFPPW